MENEIDNQQGTEMYNLCDKIFGHGPLYFRRSIYSYLVQPPKRYLEVFKRLGSLSRGSEGSSRVYRGEAVEYWAGGF